MAAARRFLILGLATLAASLIGVTYTIKTIPINTRILANTQKKAELEENNRQVLAAISERETLAKIEAYAQSHRMEKTDSVELIVLK